MRVVRLSPRHLTDRPRVRATRVRAARSRREARRPGCGPLPRAARNGARSGRRRACVRRVPSHRRRERRPARAAPSSCTGPIVIAPRNDVGRAHPPSSSIAMASGSRRYRDRPGVRVRLQVAHWEQTRAGVCRRPPLRGAAGTQPRWRETGRASARRWRSRPDETCARARDSATGSRRAWRSLAARVIRGDVTATRTAILPTHRSRVNVDGPPHRAAPSGVREPLPREPGALQYPFTSRLVANSCRAHLCAFVRRIARQHRAGRISVQSSPWSTLFTVMTNDTRD